MAGESRKGWRTIKVYKSLDPLQQVLLLAIAVDELQNKPGMFPASDRKGFLSKVSQEYRIHPNTIEYQTSEEKS